MEVYDKGEAFIVSYLERVRAAFQLVTNSTRNILKLGQQHTESWARSIWHEVSAVCQR